MATITISDDGPGIADIDAARIFDRFYRPEQSRSRQSGGSGLGLSIVAAIIDAHNGTITLDRTPTAGTSFVIEVPLAAPR